jgi:hypothetical protein
MDASEDLELKPEDASHFGQVGGRFPFSPAASPFSAPIPESHPPVFSSVK